MTRIASFALVSLVLVGLAGCSEEKTAPPVVRPVLSMVVQPAAARPAEFSGTIQPRYQTDRGFQVLGRIVARHVDVGDLVEKGQKLAENDPLTYQLAVRAGEADLARARAELDRASAKRRRTAVLVAEKISSEADLDADDQASDAAAASVRQAEASLVKAREQLRYTVLTADADGVVTSIYAEVGQMASPGTRVMTIARTDVREAVLDLPEDVVRSLPLGSPFEVRLQADASVRDNGRLREIAPQADAATRTRRVRVTLDRPVDPFRLGSTITARPFVATGPSDLVIPLTALVERDGEFRVWIVDPQAGAVRSVAVAVAERSPAGARIASGLDRGARIVVAGVNSLAEGQMIKLEQGTDK